MATPRLRFVLAVVSATATLACMAGPEPRPTTTSGFARIEAESVEVDDSCAEPAWVVEDLQTSAGCTTAEAACIDVTCQVRTLGDAAAAGTVTAIFRPGNGDEVRKSQEHLVQAGASRPITFEFTELGEDDGEPTVECVADRSTCIRVACHVTNTGDAAGTAVVQAAYSAPGAGEYAEQHTVNLAPGQTRTVTTDFSGAPGGGEGACRVLDSDLEEPTILPRP